MMPPRRKSGRDLRDTGDAAVTPANPFARIAHAPLFAALAALLFSFPALGQDDQAGVDNDGTAPIETTPIATADADIEQRISRIFSQIEPLQNVEVRVEEGVIFLTGSVSNDALAQRAVDLASRLQGVVTVNDNIERTLTIEENLTPIVQGIRSDIRRWVRGIPLFLLATGVFLVIAFAGRLLARWSWLWNRLSPNPFLADLLAQTVRIVTIVVGLSVALNLLGASALIGTILGGAGVAGLAIGFAVRDTLENYISSIMLSLRQPFRANDHVVINEYEGKVVRLTSRATVLMTLDGNQLRIPNSTVFKAVILNYTRNPERRFDFELGVDADDDPLLAIATGIEALRALPFVLSDPEPGAVIKKVGDSNIVLGFTGWVDQDSSDFWKSRSLAIRAAKTALEEHGFTLPEPIYRLRFDGRQGEIVVSSDESEVDVVAPKPAAPADDARTRVEIEDIAKREMDVVPDRHLEAKVSEERALHEEGDLLDKDRPVE